jgi:hypothetical protein
MWRFGQVTDLTLGSLTLAQWREPHNFHLLSLERFHEALELIEDLDRRLKKVAKHRDKLLALEPHCSCGALAKEPGDA